MLFLLLLLALQSLASVNCQQIECPNEWYAFAERCFLVSETRASWTGAMSSCQAMGGRLATIDNQDLQVFLANIIRGSNRKHSVSVHTGSGYNYKYAHDLGVDVTDQTSVVFSVKACNDAHVALSQDKGLDSRDTYEVVIGGWGDSLSVVRDCKQCENMDTARHTSHPLDCNVTHPFWISWSNNLIRVGTGNSVGVNQFLSWNDTDPHVVNYVAVATGWGSTGDWTFTTNTYTPGKFWVGATSLSADNQWIWVHPQDPVAEFYTNWATGEPDNAQGNQHCMDLDLADHMSWNDDICQENKNFICETDMGEIGSVVG